MPRFYLTTYAPLVSTKAGRLSSERLGIKPFVDGSIRRETDLEHRFPSISCLCRAEKFAPRLEVGDVVAYMTRKGRYGAVRFSHRRLTAILQVVEVFELTWPPQSGTGLAGGGCHEIAWFPVIRH